MFTVSTFIDKERRVYDTKALGVIWGKFSDFYGPGNTIHVNLPLLVTVEVRRLGQKLCHEPTERKISYRSLTAKGLKIRPFKNAHMTRNTDNELLHLKRYLLLIAELDTFENLNHKVTSNFSDTKRSGRGTLRTPFGGDAPTFFPRPS